MPHKHSFHQHSILFYPRLEILDQFKGTPCGHVYAAVNINSQLMAFTLTFLALFFPLQTALIFVFGNAQCAARPPYKNFAPQLFCSVTVFSTEPDTASQSMELQCGVVIVLVNVLRCVTACPQD